MPDEPVESPDSVREVKVVVESPGESFWGQAWQWIRKYLLAPLPLLIIVVVGIALIALGFKDINLGGLIGKLLGRKSGEKAIDKANSIPEDRVDKDGNVIPIGKADSKGLTQAKVVEVERPGLFDDDSQVKITPPGEDKPVVIDLPDGVKAKDVDKVIIVKPKVYAITVKDSSKVTAADVDDLLVKYGDG